MSTTIKSSACHRQQGFALLEAGLAVMIAASVFLATIEFLQISTHRTSAERIGQEVNEIFNAGISYYLANNNNWPESLQSLVTDDFLPTSALKNPWGYQYTVAESSGAKWTIGTCLPNSVADNLAAILPFGTIAASTTANCGIASSNIKYVTTTINQAINQQTTGMTTVMVKDGDSVAAPSCPLIGGVQYIPHIFLLPAAFDAGGYTISAMSAHADSLKDDQTSTYPNGYWVVHLDLTTTQGTNEDDGTSMASNPAAIVAFTNCSAPTT